MQFNTFYFFQVVFRVKRHALLNKKVKYCITTIGILSQTNPGCLEHARLRLYYRANEMY